MPTVNAYHYQKPNAANSCKNKKTHTQTISQYPKCRYLKCS